MSGVRRILHPPEVTVVGGGDGSSSALARLDAVRDAVSAGIAAAIDAYQSSAVNESDPTSSDPTRSDRFSSDPVRSPDADRES